MTVSARGVRRTTRTASVQSRKAKARTYNKTRRTRDRSAQKPLAVRKGDSGNVTATQTDRARFFVASPTSETRIS